MFLAIVSNLFVCQTSAAPRFLNVIIKKNPLFVTLIGLLLGMISDLSGQDDELIVELFQAATGVGGVGQQC